MCEGSWVDFGVVDGGRYVGISRGVVARSYEMGCRVMRMWNIALTSIS